MSTNEVITKYKPFKKMLHKSIIDNNQEVEEKKVRVDESYKYRIKGVVGNNETINDFAIIDDGKMFYLLKVPKYLMQIMKK